MAGQNKGGFNIPPPDRAELDANVKKIRSRIDDLQQKLVRLQIIQPTFLSPTVGTIQPNIVER